MYPNYPQYTQFSQWQTMPQRTEITHVNGAGGADAYQMAPNSNALLLDDTAPIVWLVQTDGAGYKTKTPYSITPYQPEPPVDLKALESRIAKLEEMINESNRSATRKKSDPE